ncbi:MAG TPA: SPW repeat protein [Azospirillum sp.]|nr:SPW repeat protein [Azospirillum sp.]
MAATETFNRGKFPDVINLIAGAILFLAPWLFGFSGDAPAAWTAWITGAVIFLLAAAALAAFAVWEEWGNLLVGIWAIISPWIVGFSGDIAAMWSHVILGIVVAAFAAWELWMVQRAPPGVHA